MAKNYRDLRGQMSPRARAQSEKLAQEMRRGLRLQELRTARQLSQQQLADRLHIQQSAISKIEQRTDMYISTLREYVRELGGELQILASFPEEAIEITQFEDLDDDPQADEER